MLIEGTGHVGVGSCVQASNAIVANAVKADMILVANGGIGSAFDELSINYEMCRAHNVRLAGVVLNKVNPEKLEEVKKYMGALLKDQWNVPLLGVVPDKTFLGCPALADLERLFNTTMISGEEHRMRHYNVSQINLITTSLGRFLENLRNKVSERSERGLRKTSILVLATNPRIGYRRLYTHTLSACSAVGIS